MQFQYLKEFIVLADTLNFLTASDELFVSQATLSRHIKDLENEIGAPLFKRSTRKVELTKMGVRLMPYANRAVKLEQEMLSDLSSYQELLKNQLTFGYVSHWDAIDLGRLTLDFQQIHPHVHISVITGTSKELLNMVGEDECSFVIVRSQAPPTENSIFLCEDPIYAFLPKSHALAANSRIFLTDLEDEPLILGDSSDLSYELALQACKIANIQPHIIYQGSGPQMANYLSQGIGVSLAFNLPMLRRMLKSESESIVQIPIEPKMCANIYMVYDPSLASPLIRELMDFVKSYLNRQINPPR